MARPANDQILRGPRIVRQQSVELSNALGADEIIRPTADPNSGTSVVVTLVRDVLPGDTCIFFVATRSGTGTGVTSASGVPGDSTVEIIRRDNGGSPSTSLVRVYFPTGALSGTNVTFNLDLTATKKAVYGWRYHNLANQSAAGVGSFVQTTSSTVGTFGTTGPIQASLLPAVHVGAITWGGSSLTQSAVPGVDEEGTLDFLGNMVVGTATPVNFLAQQRKAITGEHLGGMTMTATSSNGSAFVAVQAVWTTVQAVPAVTPAHPRLGVPGRRLGPPVVARQIGVDVVAVAGDTTVAAPIATASASAPVPQIIVSVSAPAATASASARPIGGSGTISFVQNAGAETVDTTNNTTITLTTSATIAAGDVLVGFVANRNTNGASVSSVSDNGAGGSLSWAVATSNVDTTNKYGISIFYAQAPAGLASGTVITATLTAAETRKSMGVYEFSGQATSSVVGVTTTAGAATGNPAVTLSSAATAGDMVFAAYVHNVTTASETITPFGSFVSLGTAVAGATNRSEGYAQYIIDAVGVQDAAGYTPGTDTATRWLAAAAAFHAGTTGSVEVKVSPAAATASASAPTPALPDTIAAPVATAAASSPVPVPQIVIDVPVATASASAPVPIVTTGAVVQVPVATASASAPTPTIQISVSAPVASATSSSPAPTPQLRLSPPSSTASASAPAATPQLRVSPAAAIAAATSPAPTPQVRLSPPAAAAAANALVPTVTIGGAVAPPATVAMFGYVTGTPGSGTVAAVGDAGLIIVGSSGTLGQTGSTGLVGSAYAPQDVCVLGYSNQVLGGVLVGDVETLIGRSFHGLRQNQAYTTTGVAGAVTEYDAGRTTSYRSIQFDTAPGGWAAVATGAADTQLTAFCTAVTNANRWTSQNPFLVCLHHEATLSPFGTAGFSATDYKNMWAHCVPLMLATGAPIAFAYVGWDRMFVGANGVGPPTAGQGVNDLDPGSSLYTYIGSDVYNSVDSPGVLRYGLNAATLLEPIRLAAAARGKDWMIGEMGCEDAATQADHTNKAQWLDSLRVYLDGRGSTSPGVCRVMLTTIKASAENYQVDSSAESLAAWRRLGFDVYYS